MKNLNDIAKEYKRVRDLRNNASSQNELQIVHQLDSELSYWYTELSNSGASSEEIKMALSA